MAARVLAVTKDMPRDKWLEVRRQGIGGSDAAAAVGLSRWRQPIEVYMDKVGELDSPDSETGSRMYFGQKMEGVVADFFGDMTGKKLQNRYAVLQSTEHPFMLVNVDRLVKGEKAGVELKTTSVFNKDDWGPSWTDKFPQEYYLQCLHSMAVTDMPVWYLAVLIGGQEGRIYKIERDDGAIKDLIALERQFWNEHVVLRVAPPLVIENAARAEKVLKNLYPASNGQVITLPPDAEQLAKDYITYQQTESRAKKDKENIKAQLVNILGAAERGEIAGYTVSYPRTGGEKSVFDEDVFAAEHPALYQQYCRLETTSTGRFTVKAQKEEKDGKEAASA